jgi:SAM-dependent methyltransferase
MKIRIPTPKRVARYIRREIATIQAARYLARDGVDVVRLAATARHKAANSRKVCPACGFKGPFKPFGNPPRWDALCPGCGSLERHRHLALLLDQGLVVEGLDILHLAPSHEVQIGSLLRRHARRYVTADLYAPNVDLKLNIEDINLPDASFDVIVCSHVLMYVDDKKALLEFQRILRPGGYLILMVHFIDGVSTYEDRTLGVDKHDSGFGDCDKLRIYGSDLRELIHRSGFGLKERTAEGRTAIDYALMIGEKIFVCIK